MKKQPKSYGYYYVSISLTSGQKIMRTNNERAFIVSQLQDLLSPRLLIDSVPAHKQLASCLDLLAFSITTDAIQLVIFTIDTSIITQFTHCLTTRLTQYQNEYQPQFKVQPEPHINSKKLLGPHQALVRSVELHLSHEDWEYDRYSSIGFYLHDRRGDWMRTWRLSNLYSNDAANYLSLLENRRKKPIMPTNQARLQPFAS